MQAGAFDGRAGQFDGFEVGHRRQHAGFADLNVDGFDDRLGLFGGEFVGDAPSRRTAGHAEHVLLVVAVDFDDHAVDLVIEFVLLGFPRMADVQRLLRYRWLFSYSG